MPGADPREVRLRWITWCVALLLGVSLWGFGLWARSTEDVRTVVDAFPFVLGVQAIAAVVLLVLIVTIRRMATSDPPP